MSAFDFNNPQGQAPAAPAPTIAGMTPEQYAGFAAYLAAQANVAASPAPPAYAAPAAPPFVPPYMVPPPGFAPPPMSDPFAQRPPAPSGFVPPTAAAPPQQAAAGFTPPPPDFVDIDEQTAYQPTPVGTYNARLSAALGDPSKGGPGKEPKEMVTARFTIDEGPEAGREVTMWYVTQPTFKNGKWNSRGAADIRNDLALAGRPLPPRMMFPTKGLDAARVYAQGISDARVMISVVEETRKDNKTGQMRTDRRARIVGLAGGSFTPVGAKDPFAA